LKKIYITTKNCFSWQLQDSDQANPPALPSPSSGGDTFDDIEELEWDSTGVQPQKDWEASGEAAACLTFLKGQALFNAQKDREFLRKEKAGLLPISIELHGVPWDEKPLPAIPTESELRIYENENFDNRIFDEKQHIYEEIPLPPLSAAELQKQERGRTQTKNEDHTYYEVPLEEEQERGRTQRRNEDHTYYEVPLEEETSL